MDDKDNLIEICKIGINEIEFAVDLFDKYRVFYKQDSNKKIAREFLSERLKNNESVVFIAFSIYRGNKLPVGFMQLYPSWFSILVVRDWYISDLYVEKSFRKKGIGSKLLNTAIEFGKSKFAKNVSLYTAQDNIIAQKVYEDIGFIKREKFPKSFYYQYNLNESTS